MPLRKQKNYGYIFHENINSDMEAHGYHSETLKLFYGRTHPTSIRCTRDSDVHRIRNRKINFRLSAKEIFCRTIRTRLLR